MKDLFTYLLNFIQYCFFWASFFSLFCAVSCRTIVAIRKVNLLKYKYACTERKNRSWSERFRIAEHSVILTRHCIREYFRNNFSNSCEIISTTV